MDTFSDGWLYFWHAFSLRTVPMLGFFFAWFICALVGRFVTDAAVALWKNRK